VKHETWIPTYDWSAGVYPEFHSLTSPLYEHGMPTIVIQIVSNG